MGVGWGFHTWVLTDFEQQSKCFLNSVSWIMVWGLPCSMLSHLILFRRWEEISIYKHSAWRSSGWRLRNKWNFRSVLSLCRQPQSRSILFSVTFPCVGQRWIYWHLVCLIEQNVWRWQFGRTDMNLYMRCLSRAMALLLTILLWEKLLEIVLPPTVWMHAMPLHQAGGPEVDSSHKIVPNPRTVWVAETKPGSWMSRLRS